MLIILLGIIVLLIFINCLKVVPKDEVWETEALGVYNGTWSAGIHFKIPLIEKVTKKIPSRDKK